MRGIPQMFPNLSENIWQKFGGSGVGTHSPEWAEEFSEFLLLTK